MNFKEGDEVVFVGGYGQNPHFRAIAKIVEIRKTGAPVIQILEVVPNVKMYAIFQVLWQELHEPKASERQLNIFGS